MTWRILPNALIAAEVARLAQGAAGPTGPAGSIGSAGNAGAAGVIGTAGSGGSAGAAGPVGATVAGAIGAAGIGGSVGAAGAAGLAGAAGSAGAAGPAGPQGPQAASQTSANMGPFATSSVNLSSAFADDWAPGVTKLSCFEVTSRTGNQSLTGTAGTTGGYQYQFSNTTMSLFFTGGTTIAHAEGPPAIGVNIMADSWKLDGSIRGTKNGATVVQRVAATPTYVNVTGTPSTTLGRHAGATASQCTATKYLWRAELKREATDAEQKAWTGQVNLLDRYRPPQSLRDAIAATPGSWLWEAYVDYDPAQSTSVTSVGPGPTWTRNGGAGLPAKTTIESEIEHVIQLTDWHFNTLHVSTLSQTGEATYDRGNEYREYRFTTNAVRFAVKGICDWSGVVGDGNLGLRQDDVPIDPISFTRFSDWQRLDVLGLSGSHAYRLIDGGQAIGSPGESSGVFDFTMIKGITAAIVQAPKSATFTVTPPSPQANLLCVFADSFGDQWATVSPTTESEIMQLRADYPGDVVCYAWGGGSHWHLFKDSTTYNRFISQHLTPLFAGRTSVRILDLLSPNDQGLFSTFWTDRASYRAAVGAGLDAIHTAFPSATMHWRTPCVRTAAYEGSTVTDASSNVGTGAGTAVGGVILQNIRDDQATIRSTRTAWILTLIDGIQTFVSFAPSADHGSDNFHPSGWTGGVASGGHKKIKDQAKTALAAASDSVGSGY